ncbi:MAG: geranylgeranyl reductase family protein [Alphaproteobacteria bacterium]|nr:MAG: geranylgeranyl reductase family protein [Alphaproteobacteria bacterium]
MSDAVKSYDVVVIGAGPAGSAAARQARRLGLSVAVIDKAVFPRVKLCGALLSGRGHKAMKRVFGLEPDHEHFLYSRQVAFKWDGEELVRFTAPYDLTYTYRLDLDHRLLNEAIAAGADDFQGVRVQRIDDAARRLELSTGEVLAYGVLIGADGAASPVARHLFGAAFDDDKIGFAFETEAPVPCEDEALMSIDFRIVHWGYGWNFPKKQSQTIGLGAIKGVDQDLKARMARYLKLEGADPDAVKIKGAHIPLGDYKPVPGRGAILLAGDAAGYVDPLTGEGLAYAMETGAEAAEAAAEALKAGAPETALDVYRPRIRYVEHELDKAKRLRQYAFSSTLSGLFREKLTHSQTMRQAFFDLLHGEATYDDIEKRVSKEILAKISRTMTGWPSRLAGKLRRKGARG